MNKKLHIRVSSDIHLEFLSDFFNNPKDTLKKIKAIIPPLPVDKKAVLIIAGDLGSIFPAPSRIIYFLEHVVPRFKHVIYVLGNHELYGGKLLDGFLVLNKHLTESKIDLKKLTVVDTAPAMVEIDSVRFLCATLWTDYANGDVKIQSLIQNGIADHRKIINDTGNEYITPNELAVYFKRTVEIFEGWMKDRDNSDTVVVTHHLPSFQAVAIQYLLDPVSRMFNHAFASNLDEFIMTHQPKLWFFGHTHTPYYGTLGKTTLICNPYGYPHEPKLSYDSTKLYTL